MKNYLLLFCVFSACLFVGCSKEDEDTIGNESTTGQTQNTEDQDYSNDPTQVSVTGRAYDIEGHSAKIECFANLSIEMVSKATFGVVILEDKDPLEGDAREIEGHALVDNAYSCNVTYLKHNELYYYRSFVKVGTNYIYGKLRSFRTIEDGCFIEIKDLQYDGHTITVVVESPSSCGMPHLYLSQKQDISLSNYDENIWYLESLGNGRYRGVFKGLQHNTTYYLFATTHKEGQTILTPVKDVTTKDCYSDKNTNYSMVDLGLSVKWATCNVGASKPEDYGYYFDWGNPYEYSQSLYHWTTYKWFDRISADGTDYYNHKYNRGDNLLTLLPEDDAAHVHWGGEWRMPTKAEQDELREKCKWSITREGAIVVSKINGNSIFLPLAGCKTAYEDNYVGVAGYYWSSSRYENLVGSAYIIQLADGILKPQWNYLERYIGCSVRPVHP